MQKLDLVESLKKLDESIRTKQDLEAKKPLKIIDFYSEGKVAPKVPLENLKMEADKIASILKPEHAYYKTPTMLKLVYLYPVFTSLSGFQEAYGISCDSRILTEYGTTTGTICGLNSSDGWAPPIVEVNAAAEAFGYEDTGISLAAVEAHTNYILPAYSPTNIHFKIRAVVGVFGTLNVKPPPAGIGTSPTTKLTLELICCDYDGSKTDPGLGGYYRLRGTCKKVFNKTSGLPELIDGYEAMDVDMPQDVVPFPSMWGPVYFARVTARLEALAGGKGSLAIGDFATGSNKITMPCVYSFIP